MVEVSCKTRDERGNGAEKGVASLIFRKPITCCDTKSMELLGTGGYSRKGKTTNGKYYDGYYCSKCKRVYIACHFHGRDLVYSPVATRQHLEGISEKKCW